MFLGGGGGAELIFRGGLERRRGVRDLAPPEAVLRVTDTRFSKAIATTASAGVSFRIYFSKN